MTSLSAGRTRLALLALALGGFGIGSTEFVVMGLLPEIAADLLPALDAVDHEQAIAQTGWLISSYALGVVVGAPTIAAFSSHFPRKRLLLALLAAITVATFASALLPSFGLVFAARFAAGLPHGAYFGIASLVAADLMGPGNRGRGVAFVLSGLTIANVVGVPAITVIGQGAGWRVAYLVVALVFALAFAAVAVTVPYQPGDRTSTFRRQLSAFRRPQVWATLGFGAIGFGGFFAVYSYVADVVRDVTGLDPAFVPVALVCVGLGMTLGNIVGGRAADISIERAIYGCFAVFGVALVGFALTAQWTAGLLAFLFLLGAGGSALTPNVQTRLLDVSGDAQSLAAALLHSSFNLGNSLGAFLGGATIAAGFGLLSPAWVGVALAVIGATIAVISFAVERRPVTGSWAGRTR